MIASVALLFCGLFTSSIASAATGRFVSYIDAMPGWNDALLLEGLGVPGHVATNEYNILNIGFWLSSGTCYDALDTWIDPTMYFSAAIMQSITGKSNPTDNDFRSSLIKLYHDNNIKILASAFGAIDYPTSTHDPITLGLEMASFVKNYSLDGFDIDWEDTNSFTIGTGLGENWLINLTTTLRDNLPSNDGYIITHAPQAPYFMGKDQYPAGGYLTVHNTVGKYIDWYNIQFYNQGTSDYTTYSTLFESANGWANGTSVYEMMNGINDLKIKIDSEHIVVGKPVTTGDATNTGYVDPSSLKSIFTTAIHDAPSNDVWQTGFMSWQFSSDIRENFDFVNTVSEAFS